MPVNGFARRHLQLSGLTAARVIDPRIQGKSGSHAPRSSAPINPSLSTPAQPVTPDWIPKRRHLSFAKSYAAFTRRVCGREVLAGAGEMLLYRRTSRQSRQSGAADPLAIVSSDG